MKANVPAVQRKRDSLITSKMTLWTYTKGIKKMTYNNLKELAAAAMDVDLKDVEKTRYIGNLISVYFDAEKNPPEGIIGVGAISYAEYQLIKAQESI
jgi:hypothetical protein